MNASTLVKINFLVLGFALCAYTIYCLKNDGLPQSLTDFVGLPSTSKTDYLTWCSTRATKIHINENTSLFQKGTRWYSSVNGEESVVDTIAMEKWFSKYCRIGVKFVENQPLQAGFSDKLGIEFVNGVVTYFKSAKDTRLFQWKTRYFQSKNLETALTELNAIVQ